MTEKSHDQEDVEVHVTFAAANQPYNHKYEATATISAVLRGVMAFFGIQTDGTSRYFLLAGGNEQDGGTTVGSLAEDGPGHSHSLRLSLRTETTSGKA